MMEIGTGLYPINFSLRESPPHRKMYVYFFKKKKYVYLTCRVITSILEVKSITILIDTLQLDNFINVLSIH